MKRELLRRPDDVLSSENVSVYQRSHLSPEPGDLVRVQSGVVMRVVGFDEGKRRVRAKRRSGQVGDVHLEDAQLFRPSEGDIRIGSILEWKDGYPEFGLDPMNLTVVMDLHPTRGIAINWSKKGESQTQYLFLDPGLWYCAIANDEPVAHRRDRGPLAAEAFSDLKQKPPWLTHDEDLDSIARPFALRTMGGPPVLTAFQRGNQLLIESAGDDIPSGYLFVVAEVDTKRSRIFLVEGRELSARATKCGDRWYTPRETDRVRLYQPSTTIARSDLLWWKRPDCDLGVRRGNCGEVMEVMEDGIAVTGVTDTPEVLSFDPRRWTAVSCPGSTYLRRRKQ